MNGSAQPAEQNARTVMVLTLGVPHPTDGASTVLYHHYLEAMARAGHRVRHVALLEQDQWSDAEFADHTDRMASAGDVQVTPLRLPRFVRSGWSGVSVAGRDAVAALHRDAEPDLLIAFDIVPALMASGVKGRRLAWLGDLVFETSACHFRYSVCEQPATVLKWPKVALVGHHWKEAYRTGLADFDEIICASASSVDVLRPLGLVSRYEPYPWPAERVPDPLPPKAEQPTFLFFGNLGALGSRSALHWMQGEILPHLRAAFGAGGFSILIAGRGTLPQWATGIVGANPEVKAIGFVEDLVDLMLRCHAVIAPIDVPVGNRSRILTALSSGALVIAHGNVALGNPDLRDGVTCLLANDGRSFANKMTLAVRDPAACAVIAEAGRSLYRDSFAPEVAGARLNAVIGRLTGAAG